MGKRPASGLARPEQEDQYARSQRSQTEKNDLPVGGSEHKQPAAQGHQTGQWIKPDAVGPGHLGRAPAQEGHGKDLPDKLYDDARDEERIDHNARWKKAADDGYEADDHPRHMRKSLLWMQPAENLEEVTILRRRVGNARIAEQQRENRTDGGPKYHHRENGRHLRAVKPFH